MSQNFSCGNAIPTQFLMWERRSHAFPPHSTTALNPYCSSLHEKVVLTKICFQLRVNNSFENFRDYKTLNKLHFIFLLGINSQRREISCPGSKDVKIRFDLLI